MSGKTCPECSKTFNRPADMRRHCQEIHGTGGSPGDRIPTKPSPPYAGKPKPDQDQVSVLKHPFTMCVSGPTSCGKTFLVKKILQSILKKKFALISPNPQRIIWLYKRWQPLYDEMKATVYPPIEFHQGIPDNLENDEYMNPEIRNLIILDDLMSTASKDRGITDLFTEGSHHRNLSVISLNQNLYYSKDPTQRRNCHYMVLFNNPVDQQPMMTLARQMYPQNPCVFMREFERATSKPHGYLLVDLKPYTLPDDRLRPNGLEGIISLTQKETSLSQGVSKRDWKRYCNDDEDEPELPTMDDLYRKERKRSRVA